MDVKVRALSISRLWLSEQAIFLHNNGFVLVASACTGCMNAGISTESFNTIVWCQVHPGIHGSHTCYDCKIVGWDCRLYLLTL